MLLMYSDGVRCSGCKKVLASITSIFPCMFNEECNVMQRGITPCKVTLAAARMKMSSLPSHRLVCTVVNAFLRDGSSPWACG
jgi:hypothetical protein